MKYSILVIGGGASGLMAAYSAAKTLVASGSDASVAVVEKMPKPGRKIMITGKGRCNFTNLKPWNAFSTHIRSNQNFVKGAFHSLPPEKVIAFFESFGMKTVIERGDRAYPASYHASDVVDTLVNACNSVGVKILCDTEVLGLERIPDGFVLTTGAGSISCRRLILATGGLSYPTTGSTGDGYRWASELGHGIEPQFPSLTAMVPDGYKDTSLRGHIARETPLSEFGARLCGVQLKNVQVSLFVEGSPCGDEFGDIDFTDGGLEGPVGFQLSRKAVKALSNGSRVSLSIDMKPGVPLQELSARVKELWAEVDKDPRSRGLHEKEKCRIMLGKLMPWDLIPGFVAANPSIMTLERRSRTETKVWVNLPTIAKALKEWKFDIRGYVGYERAVVTAGGVSTKDILSKTMESRVVPGLYFCGEVTDMDCDTGGYNLQCAFCTGNLAGENAAKSMIDK
ncbi:MAG: NAD(P)/FAD-dependent oxidoreductase [Bacteroidales bacterium]|nr:NAD(P)/FAD-dependent oxidoreductase [Bacteroidales bacterium]